MILTTILLLQAAQPDLRPQLDSIVPALMREHGVPGAAIAIVRDGTTLLAAYGSARQEPQVAVDATVTRFRLGSIGKVFVAATVAHAVRAGRLALDDDIRPRIGETTVTSRLGSPVTLRQLLTHTAGFDERLIGYAARSTDAMRPLGEYLGARLPQRGWPPGRLVGYSNHGVALAAYVVERAAGLPFRDVAARELFEPLGMHRTAYLAPDSSADAPDRATGFRCAGTRCERVLAPYSHAYPVGLVHSTASDMGRFVQALLTTMPADERALLLRRHFTHDPELAGMGLGFFEQRWGPTTVWAHSGVVPGFTNLLAVAPSEGVGIVVLSNGTSTRFTSAARDVLMGLLLGTPPAAAFATVGGDVGAFAGPYRMTRYAHATIERFPLVFATGIRVMRAGDTLLVPFGAARLPMVRIDSLRFREVGGHRVVAFARDGAGRVTHMFAPANVAGAELPAAFERTPWYEVPGFLNEYASWLILGPVLLLIGWGVASLTAALVRRLRSRGDRRPAPLPRGWWVLLAAPTFAFAVLGLGFIARTTRDLERSEGIVFGLTGTHVAFLAIPWLIVALAVLQAVFTARMWRGTAVRTRDRVLLALCGTALLLQLHFLVTWNYLPARW